LTGCLQGFLCFRYRRWRGPFPAFFAYLVFHLVTYVVLYLALYHGSPRVYSYLYWYKRVMGTFFLVFAVFEVSSRRQAIERHRYLGYGIGLALTIAQAPQFRLWLDNAITLTLCLPLLFLLWTGSEKRIGWWMAAGLALWGIASTTVQYDWGHAQLRFLGTYVYLLVQVLWIFGSFHARTEAAARENGPAARVRSACA
jgi:hypothetical protein